jgi:ubiquitin-activating enzyme E1
MSANNSNIDNNLYDRQIRTYGEEAVKKMSTSSVLIMGLSGGLGTEIGKNLALGGIKNIYLHDSTLVTSLDLKTGFYYSEDTIGMVKSLVLQSRLQELNPYVTIHTTETYLVGQDVTILVNQPVSVVEQVSQWTRENKSKLVVLYSKGVSGVVFVDAGTSHIVTDATGENIEPVQVGGITSDGKVVCATHASHDFQSGDTIEFTNLEGTGLDVFAGKQWTIKVNNPTSFQLANFESTVTEPFVFINGTAVHIKKPINVTHCTWSEQVSSPTLAFSFDMDLAEKLVQTYLKMFATDSTGFGSIWSDETTQMIESLNVPLPEYARIFGSELMPVVSLMGSIASSEAIKLVTNKYMPVSQWFTWSDNILVPKSAPVGWEQAKTDYGKLFGLEVESKLINGTWLMVGSGAIGCEHLKNLAFMGVADNSIGSGEIILTDPDSIEKSNLNRQFLFRSHHITQPKSVTAATAIKSLKPDMKITPYLEKVGPDNQNFTNGVMSRVTGVLNALDNIKARRFMDEQCFKYGLPLFESGTTGTKGNTQPVVPFVTETYSASSDPEQEKSFPICTIKSFPNEIAHTIHWAMDQFEFFNRGPSTMNKWIANPEYVGQLSQVEKSIAMEDINLFTFKYPTQQDGLVGCARWAVDMFTENYYNGIMQLLHTFKPDHEVAPGVPFWSAGKRCPQPVQFDINNGLHLKYIEATTHLIARCSGILDNFTLDDLIGMIASYEPVKFVPKVMTIAASDAELAQSTTQTIPETEEKIQVGSSDGFVAKYVAQEFEKDDDSNWHIDWVTAASNLRAGNYGIPQSDRAQTKGIAGRIIPAISTTTSAVSGLVLLEMVKYLCGFNKVDSYRSTFINLAEPVLVYSDPIEASQIDVAGIKMNSWTKFEYNKNSTLGEFKTYYEQMFKTNVSMIVVGSTMVYAEFLGAESLDKSMAQVMREVCDVPETEPVPSMVTFSVLSEEETKDIPPITVTLKEENYSVTQQHPIATTN